MNLCLSTLIKINEIDLYDKSEYNVIEISNGKKYYFYNKEVGIIPFLYNDLLK